MSLLLPDSGLLFWMTIIFVIVFFLLAKFGFPVITGMVEKRTGKINDALAAAREAEERLAHLAQEQERLIEEARGEQDRILREAVAEREGMIAKAREEASAEASRIMDEARIRIQEEKEAALRDIRQQIAVISMTVAEKVIRKDLESESGQAQLIDKMVDEVRDIS